MVVKVSREKVFLSPMMLLSSMQQLDRYCFQLVFNFGENSGTSTLPASRSNSNSMKV